MASRAVLIEVIDTREYAEIAPDKWGPIPGTGESRPCDRCGRLHEVHAHVEVDGQRMVVGTGCMGADFAKEARKAANAVARRASAAAELAELEARVASYLVARDAADVKVAAMPVSHRVVVNPWSKRSEVQVGEGVNEATAEIGWEGEAGAVRRAAALWRVRLADQLAEAASGMNARTHRNAEDRIASLRRRLG